MFPVLSCSCICTIHWSQVLNREWRCDLGSDYRRCSNYICVINRFVAYWGADYIIYLIVKNLNLEKSSAPSKSIQAIMCLEIHIRSLFADNFEKLNKTPTSLKMQSQTRLTTFICGGSTSCVIDRKCDNLCSWYIHVKATYTRPQLSLQTDNIVSVLWIGTY